MLGRARENDLKYCFPPLDDTKARSGNVKANITIGSINAFSGKVRVEFIKLQIESRSIIKKLKNAVPQCEPIISKKKLPILFSKIKHLAFSNNHFKWNIVRFVRKGIQNERGI